METYFKITLTKGQPKLKAINGEEKDSLDSFVVSCDEGQIVRAEFEKTTRKHYNAHRKNAHYFAYLRRCISNFETISNELPAGNAHKQVAALHLRLKALALTEKPHLLRTIEDKDGKPTYHLFSLRIEKKNRDPFALTDKERNEYIDWAFEYLMNIQKSTADWVLPPYSEVA